MIKAVIFDLDGTLADTLNTLAYFSNKTLEHIGLVPIETERFRYLVGRGATVLMEQMLLLRGKEPDKQTVEKMLADFNEMYLANTMYLTKPYPGIEAMLRQVRTMGIKTAVFSNKPDAAAQKVVPALFDIPFDFVLGKREELPRKPAPDGALLAAKAMGVTPEECLYVGDTDTDMQTGAAAGMTTAGVLWGFRTERELRENNACIIAKEPQDIVNAVRRLNGQDAK